MSRKEKSIADLPNEFIHRILRYSDPGAIRSCTLVCHRLHDIVRQSTELRYLFELGLDGLVDCATSTSSYHERLKDVLERRRSWANISWRKSSSIRLPGRGEHLSAYDCVAGVLAKLSQHRTFIAVHLPSINDPVPHWIKHELAFPAKTFAMDPTQDLVVFLEKDPRPKGYNGQRSVRIHIQTLSTGDPHPLAQNSSLTFDVPPYTEFRLKTNYIWFSCIKLAADIVLMQYNIGHEWMCFRFWNWMTGHDWMIEGYPGYFVDCSFISSRAVMLTSTRGMGSLHVYTFEFEGPSPAHVTLKANLHLPKVRQGIYYEPVETRTTPILGLARTPASKTTVPSLESQLNMMSMKYGIGDDEYLFHLFVPNSLLLGYATNPWVGEVGWEDWGPQNTRLIETTHMPSGLRFANGFRVISSPTDDPLQPAASIQIYDFNPSRRQEYDVPLTDFGATQRSYSNAYVIHREIFEEDVLTRLPVWHTSRSLDPSYWNFFIDDERIVGMKNPADDDSDDSDCEDIEVFVL
ncbi:hypothetical protein EYR36_001937 [Pleurotus pulmonarius]|nr:hypothetical protein EYR36_001937 [Pleurotus pulmonarius]KAF4588312.1 hypothetical protein EYR38_010279 [Pleurotus pulmonarius]